MFCSTSTSINFTSQVRNHIIANGGSIADIPDISPDLKEIYRTVWEIRQRSLIDMAADRGKVPGGEIGVGCTEWIHAKIHKNKLL